MLEAMLLLLLFSIIQQSRGKNFIFSSVLEILKLLWIDNNGYRWSLITFEGHASCRFHDFMHFGCTKKIYDKNNCNPKLLLQELIFDFSLRTLGMTSLFNCKRF